MKKHIGRRIALVLLLVLLAGAFLWFCGGETNVGYPMIDYAAISLEDLYQQSHLVVTGRYLGDERTCGQEGTGTPQTIGKVQVETVYKGEAQDGDTIQIRFTGGTISLREYISKRPEEAAKKQGFSGIAGTLAMARLGNKVTVEFDAMVDARPQQDYLMFFSYDEEAGVYQVLADAYAMRLLDENGKAYDPYSKSYQTFPAFLTETQN